MKPGTKKQSSRRSLHPLDALLLETAEDSKSMIGWLAQRNVEIARDKEDCWFTRTAKSKIEKQRYRPPDSKRDKQSFNEILKRGGVLETFLSRPFQREIEKWVLLRDILLAHRSNKQEGKSDAGFPAQFHRSMMTALLEHLETIEVIAEKYDSKKGIESYYSSARREFVR